jgi:hypothetical protein
MTGTASSSEITKKSQGPRVEKLQKALDRELVHWKFPWRKIKIDGIAGPHRTDEMEKRSEKRRDDA